MNLCDKHLGLNSVYRVDGEVDQAASGWGM